MTHPEFLKAVEASCAALHEYISTEDAYELGWTLKALLDDGGGLLEEQFNEFRGSGSYKEAYQVGNLCIKFAVAGDIIENEIKVYNRAAQLGVQKFFCPSYFHKLPDNITIPLMELGEVPIYAGDPHYDIMKGGPKGYHYGPQFAAYVILQPIVGLVNDLTCPNSPTQYADTPLILQDGSQLSVDEYLIIDAPLEWREAIISVYGDLDYRDLTWALKRMDVDDLHEGNVGWLGDYPVIIDWMSLRPGV